LAVIELSDNDAAALKAKAAAVGLTLEAWLKQLAGSAQDSEPTPSRRHRHVWEIIADNMKDVPAQEFARLPKDGASQIDHYLYGHPKR